MEPVFFATPAEFRRWLSKHHRKETELLVGYYKKASGLPSITWPESVEQALCFGWIDGIRRSIDERSYSVRFTPRRPGSIWSAVNLQTVERLTRAGLMRAAGIEAYEKRTDKKSVRYSYERQDVRLDPAYEKQIRAEPVAWEFFEKLPPSSRKPSIWWVMSAKKEATRLRRLGILIDCSARGEKVPPLVVTKKKGRN